ncbi:MAG: hypothetical protein RQ760_01695 [Sedimentisphaerales bacterium]|nr:hypothetical protein [Sedimentisphaerales bacterium]
MSEQIEKVTIDDGDTQTPDAHEEEIDLYPLREPSEDPRWAVRTVWVWVSIAVFLLLFIIVLLILGLWYD